jgi:NAD(P)H dehydrogenase (quinone)
MQIHAIIDHPNPASFNHAVLHAFIDGACEAGHTVDLLDLNQDGFDPVMTTAELSLYPTGGVLDPQVRAYQQRLQQADFLALFFPIWWMVMPARLKGWLDKVLLPGFAFTEDQFPQPLLTRIQSAAVFTTTAVGDEDHRRQFRNALEWVLCRGTLQFIGIEQVEWLNFGETGFASQETHTAWLASVREYARRLSPPRAG